MATTLLLLRNTNNIFCPSCSRVFLVHNFVMARHDPLLSKPPIRTITRNLNTTNSNISTFSRLRAYVLAMVGNYDPLLEQYRRDKHGDALASTGPDHRSPMPSASAGGWDQADAETRDAVLIRLYNFEKRLVVAGLALLYVVVLVFFLAMAVYLRSKTITKKKEPNLEDLRVWETKFGTGTAIPFEQFVDRHLFSEKFKKLAYYESPPLLLVTLEDDSVLLVDCRRKNKIGGDEANKR